MQSKKYKTIERINNFNSDKGQKNLELNLLPYKSDDQDKVQNKLFNEPIQTLRRSKSKRLREKSNENNGKIKNLSNRIWNEDLAHKQQSLRYNRVEPIANYDKNNFQSNLRMKTNDLRCNPSTKNQVQNWWEENENSVCVNPNMSKESKLLIWPKPFNNFGLSQHEKCNKIGDKYPKHILLPISYHKQVTPV